jgi:hypothetical protein
MKTPIRAVEDRNDVAGLAKPNRLIAEQTDHAGNKAVTVRDHNSSSKRRAVQVQERAETTVLERRVLAHERILQSLIAHMTETEPRFLERLQKTFHVQIKFHEQDYIYTEDFAAEFVRAVEDTVLSHRTKANSRAKGAGGVRAAPKKQGRDAERIKPAGFQIRNRNGIWEVTEDGLFYGHYFHEQLAKDAVQSANQKSRPRG